LASARRSVAVSVNRTPLVLGANAAQTFTMGAFGIARRYSGGRRKFAC
jgi:hypothetical protein